MLTPREGLEEEWHLSPRLNSIVVDNCHHSAYNINRCGTCQPVVGAEALKKSSMGDDSSGETGEFWVMYWQ